MCTGSWTYYQQYYYQVYSSSSTMAVATTRPSTYYQQQYSTYRQHTTTSSRPTSTNTVLLLYCTYRYQQLYYQQYLINKSSNIPTNIACEGTSRYTQRRFRSIVGNICGIMKNHFSIHVMYFALLKFWQHIQFGNTFN